MSNPLGNPVRSTYVYIARIQLFIPPSTTGHKQEDQREATAIIPLTKFWSSCFYSVSCLNTLSKEHSLIVLKYKSDPVTPLLKTILSWQGPKTSQAPIFPLTSASLLSLFTLLQPPWPLSVSKTLLAYTSASRPLHLLFPLPDTCSPRYPHYLLSPLYRVSKGQGGLSLICSLLYPHGLEKRLAWNSCSKITCMSEIEIVTRDLSSRFALEGHF